MQNAINKKSQKKYTPVKCKIKAIFLYLSKILIVLFTGILCAWIFFELTLFTFGKIQRFVQTKKNTVIKNDEYVILCLGESTTAPIMWGGEGDLSWPAFLQVLLNKKNINKKIKIINEGVISTNSTVILDHLEKNLEKHQPDLIITMMGINDLGEIAYEQAAGIKNDNLKSKSRVYKLIKFLITSLKKKYEQNKNAKDSKLNCESEEECFNLTSLEDLNSLEVKNLTIAYLNKALEYNKASSKAFARLSYIYSLPESNIAKVLDYSEKALEIDPYETEAYWALIKIAPKLPYNNILIEKIEKDLKRYNINNGWVYLDLANYHEFEGEKDRIVYLKKAQNLLKKPYIKLRMARYYREKGSLKLAEEYYLQILKAYNGSMSWGNNSAILIEIAQLYNDMGNKELAEFYWLKSYNADTKHSEYIQNYEKLYQKLKGRNVKLIAVQYPMRSIKPLQLIFQDKEDVLIVDNEQTFIDLVKENSYDTIFIDSFAGDFGHVAGEYNEFIAKNITTTIVENWESLNNKN